MDSVKYPVFQIILDRLKSNKRIQDEQYIALQRAITEIISQENGEYDVEGVADLHAYITRKCMNVNIQELDGNTAFELGAIWGMMKVLKTAKDKNDEIPQSEMSDDVAAVLQMMKQKPGITTKEIATQMGKSYEDVVQLLRRLEKEKIIRTIKLRQCKGAFLTEK